MHASATTRSHLVKALRVLLVFSLVFWSAFRVEMVAFAEGEESEAPPATGPVTENPNSENADSPSEDQGGNASDGRGGDNPGANPDGGTTGGDESGGAPDNNQGGDTGTGAGSETGNADQGSSSPAQPSTATATYDRFEIHLFKENANTEKDEFAYLGDFICSSKEDQKLEALQKIETPEGALSFVPVVVMKKGDDYVKEDIATLVEWSVDDNTAAVIEPGVKAKQQTILKATGKKNAKVTVKCELKDEAVKKYGLSGEAKKELSFSVTVDKQQSLTVVKIELLDEHGDTLSGANTLEIPFDKTTGATYQFAARVYVKDAASRDDSGEGRPITTSDAKDLSEDEKRILEGLTWSVDDPDLATIDNTGSFKTDKRIETVVKCSAAETGGVVLGRVPVNTGIDNAVQGDFHPQDSLRVVYLSEDAKGAVSETSNVSGEAGSSDEEGRASKLPDGQNAPMNGDGLSSAPGGESGEAAVPSVIDEVYSLDRLQSVGWTTGVEQTLVGSAAAGATGDTTTIRGEGPNLGALLDDAGVDMGRVETLTFVDYNNILHRLSWPVDLSSEAIMAASSLVVVEGQEGQGADGALLRNTRFRLLPGDGASLDSAFPWIKAIYVNDATPDSSGNGSGKGKDKSLTPIIFYNPVPEGYSAVLTAAVVGLYEGEQFGLSWSVSSDGLNWSGSVSTAQTIDVPTSGNIGLMYKVTVTTSNGRENDSEPVTIRLPNENDFSVNLSYIPPLAGEIAFFNTKVFGVDSSEITDYIWEWTENGGDTWQEIAGSRGSSTFSAQTDPIADTSGGTSEEEGSGTGSEGDGKSSGSSESAEKEIDRTPASAMWVRVRVQATEGREAISNPVMLTVHVKEDPGAGQAPTEDIPDDVTEEPSTPGSDEPVVTPADTSEETSSSTSEPTTGPVMQEVTSITQESAPRSQSPSQVVTSQPATEQTPDGTETAPTPESAASDSPTDLVINPQVTAEILEQREAVNAAVQATRPGARWTALTTVDPDGKDIQRILNDNPFVPFTAPFALGITAAGFVEKLLGFRRQVR